MCAAEQELQIAPQVLKAFAHRVRTLLRFGEDECTLQHRLDKVSDTLRSPWGSRRVALFRRHDVRHKRRDVRRHAALAGRAKAWVSDIGLLNQGTEQAGVV